MSPNWIGLPPLKIGRDTGSLSLSAPLLCAHVEERPCEQGDKIHLQAKEASLLIP